MIDDKKYNIFFVKAFINEIRHYVEGDISSDIIGKKVFSFIDKDKRLINAMYHTAGHLVSHVIESHFPWTARKVSFVAYRRLKIH